MYTYIYGGMFRQEHRDRGQSAVNGQNGVLAAGQRSKYPETVIFNSEN